MLSTHAADNVTPYQVFMLTLCLLAIGTLAAGALMPLDDQTEVILVQSDRALCVVFLIDFLFSLYRAPKRMHYFLTWGWIDLLSSIPVAGPLRIGRAARAMRILRVLRGVKSARAIAHFLVARRAQSASLATVLLALLILVFSSVAILQFEAPSGGNIQTAEDAMWWAVSTMTTVGYGDRYPITSEGRLVAIFLMASGVGVFGLLSGLMASWFLSPGVQEADRDLSAIEQQLAEIKEHLRLQSHANQFSPPPNTTQQ